MAFQKKALKSFHKNLFIWNLEDYYSNKFTVPVDPHKKTLKV